MTMFAKIRAAAGAQSKEMDTLQALQGALRKNGGSSFIDANTSNYSFGLEGIDLGDTVALGDATAALESAATVIREAVAKVQGVTPTGLMAAQFATALTGNIKGFLGSTPALEARALAAGALPASDAVQRLRPALESYDEKENVKASQYTITYNLHAARQDEFGEALYPTVIVPPDEMGFNVGMDLVNVHNEVRRGTDDAVEDWGVKNLVFAYRNPEILASDSTTLHPVWRESGAGANAKAMVAKSILSPRNITPYNETFATQPLAIGAKFSLLKICQTDRQLDAGHNDSSDAVDTDIQLTNIYAKFGDDVVKVGMTLFRGHQFNYSVQDDNQKMVLQLETDSVLFKPTTKTFVNGVTVGDLATLKAIKDNDLEVRISLSMFGSVMRDYGTTEVHATKMRVVSIRTAGGDLVALDDLSVKPLVDAIEAGEVVGYDLNARRVNTNRRTLGKLLQTRRINQLYSVPLMTTLAIQRPQSVSDSTDASDLGYLITGTRAAASGAAVDELLRFSVVLPEVVSSRAGYDENTKVLGPAAQLLKPFHKKVKVEIDKTINLTNTYELAKNLQATLVNAIREHIFTGWRESNLKAAYDMTSGGSSEMPLVLIATDQYMSRYLQIDGDLRTIGGGFDKYKVVESSNHRMDGRMFVTLVPRSMPEGVPHPFSFGWMPWKPEVAVVLPIVRNGAANKELIVQPSYRHVSNLPFLIEVEVTGIPRTVETRVPFKVEGVIGTP